MKLPKKHEVRTYELTFLVPHALTTDEAQAVQTGVEKLVKKQKGTVQTKDEWGKKHLAYTVQIAGKRYDEAVYHHWVVELLPSSVQSITDSLRHVDHVIRSLVVQAAQESSEKTAA